jgi:hypothetical protein
MPISEDPHIEAIQRMAELFEHHCQKLGSLEILELMKETEGVYYALKSRETTSGSRKLTILGVRCLVSYGGCVCVLIE